MQNATIITVILYFLISLLIGVYRTKRITPRRFIGQRNTTGFFYFLATIVTIVIGGGMFFAVGQIGYEAGIIGYIIGIAYLVGFFVLGALSYRLRNIVTEENPSFYDFFQKKYNSKRLIRLFQIMNLILFFLILGGQFVAISSFIKHSFNIASSLSTIIVSVVITAGIVIIYSIVGGYEKDIATDVFQFIVIIIGLIIISGIIFNKSVVTLIGQLPSGYFNGIGPSGSGYGIVYSLGALFFIIPSFFVRMDFWQRILAAKSARIAEWGFILSGIICLIAYVIFTSVGMYAKAYGVPPSTYSSIEIFRMVANRWQYLAITVAFLAAVMSSADTFINAAGISLVRTFWPNLWDKSIVTETDPNSRKRIRARFSWVILFLGIISASLAIIVPDIVDLFSGAFAIIIVAVPTVLAALVSKKINEKAGFYSMLTGLLASLIAFPFLPKVAFAPGFVISIVVFFTIVILDKNRYQISR
jgi:SSS family solute:Na+ symporter